MQVYSLTFLFIVLPVTLLLYLLAPKKAKNYLVLFFSLSCYALTDFRNLMLFVGSLLFDFVLSKYLAMYQSNLKVSRLLMAISLVKNLALVLLFSIRKELGMLPLAYGYLVYSITALSYMLDIYRGAVQREDNLVRYGVFTTFFPSLTAGPVGDYAYTRKSLLNQRASLSGISSGLILFLQGLAKKVILADQIMIVANRTLMIESAMVTTLSAWTLVISVTFSVYFYLSSLSDMAKGLGQMFGLSLPENFNHPLQARTVEEFFSRFNVTVNRFIRKNVYFVLDDDKGGFLAAAFNILLTCMLMGLWFGININMLIWGACLGVFIIFEHFVLAKHVKKLPNLLMRLYTFFVVTVSFVFFAVSTPQQSGFLLQTMFTTQNGQGLYADNILYILSSNYLLILMCFIFSTSLMKKLLQQVNRLSKVLYQIIYTILNLGLFVLTLSFMM